MTSNSNLELQTLQEVFDLIGQPMFLLDVVGPSEFVFRGLNRNHKDTSGLDESPLLGKSPHEVFPTRLADTIVKNYEACRAQRAPHTYEEILELGFAVAVDHPCNAWLLSRVLSSSPHGTKRVDPISEAAT